MSEHERPSPEIGSRRTSRPDGLGPSPAKPRILLKAALSVFVAYHLFCVALLPNAASIIGRRLGAVLTPYANPFIFNRTWQFFSPGPMPSFYLEYEVVTPENELDVMRETLTYPPVPLNWTISDLYLRGLAGMRFLGIKDETFVKFFVPWLCRQHPEATALDIRSVMEEVPQMESLSDESAMSFKDLAEKKDLPRRTYECPGRGVSMKGDIDAELETLDKSSGGDGTGGRPEENEPGDAPAASGAATTGDATSGAATSGDATAIQPEPAATDSSSGNATAIEADPGMAMPGDGGKQ